MIDFNEFLEKYKGHLEWLGVEIPSLDELEKIWKIFSFVTKNGGWVRTIGLNQWKRYSNDARHYFESNFLVSFERFLQKKWPYSASETKSINFSLLQTASIYSSVRSDQWEELLAEDLSVYRNVYNLGIREDLISLDSIKAKHGELEITVLLQESNPSELSLKNAKSQKMKIKDYVKLMQCPNKHEKYIKFAVNIDFGNWNEEVDELRKFLPAQILWCSSEDCLRHLRQNVLGMSLPQMYLKIRGCWTGGHEENLRFPSANINHGPSACEWWGLDSTQSLQLRECIMRDKNFEIYSNETLWWPDEIYCLINGFRLFHVIQLPGDLVTVGAGTIHWVKSLGVTTNTAWNFGPKYLKNFQKSIERDYINKAIKYKSLVPMNILSLDLINNEIETLDIGLLEYLRDGILNKFDEDFEVFKQSGFGELLKNSMDNVIHCEMCYQELFRIYYKCLKCEQRRLNGCKVSCFFCYYCIKNIHKRCKGKIEAIEKFSQEDFDKLLKEIDQRCEGKPCKSVESIKYPFDKNKEEGVYVSLFNGVKVDNEDKSQQTATITIMSSENKVESAEKAKKLLKKPKKSAKPEQKIKLRSFPAKKRMLDNEDESKPCKNMSDLHRLLKVLETSEKKETQNEDQSPEKTVEKIESKVIFYKDTKEGKRVVIENNSAKTEKIQQDFNVLTVTQKEKNDSFLHLPMKRIRSRDSYSPVISNIPSKNS